MTLDPETRSSNSQTLTTNQLPVPVLIPSPRSPGFRQPCTNAPSSSLLGVSTASVSMKGWVGGAGKRRRQWAHAAVTHSHRSRSSQQPRATRLPPRLLPGPTRVSYSLQGPVLKGCPQGWWTAWPSGDCEAGAPGGGCLSHPPHPLMGVHCRLQS